MSSATASISIGTLLDELAGTLAGAGVPPDRGGARDLIAAVLDRPRFWPTAHRDTPLDEAQHAAARRAADALRRGMPFAYAVGKAAFRHLTLKVDRRVLIPRPETEVLVDLALAATGGRGTIADVGTGSGAIALALAAEGQFERVIATDLSEAALDVARANLDAIPADRRHVVEFRQGDLTAPLAGERVTALVSNPPYIATSERDTLPASVLEWEPAGALFSGDDGMYAIDRLIGEAADVVAPGGLFLLELDARRAQLAMGRAETNGRWSDVQIRRDLTGRERFLVARRSTR
jgi:release factor glutamine methyltransferase